MNFAPKVKKKFCSEKIKKLNNVKKAKFSYDNNLISKEKFWVKVFDQKKSLADRTELNRTDPPPTSITKIYAKSFVPFPAFV